MNKKRKTQSENVKNAGQNWKTDLKVRSYYFSIAIIRFMDSLEDRRSLWTIRDQLLRSATSIGANIVEGKAASSRRDFIKYYQIALKSANETKYWLGLLRDALGIDRERIQYLLGEVTEISNMLGASIITLKNKKF